METVTLVAGADSGVTGVTIYSVPEIFGSTGWRLREYSSAHRGRSHPVLASGTEIISVSASDRVLFYGLFQAGNKVERS